MRGRGSSTRARMTHESLVTHDSWRTCLASHDMRRTDQLLAVPWCCIELCCLEPREAYSAYVPYIWALAAWWIGTTIQVSSARI